MEEALQQTAINVVPVLRTCCVCGVGLTRERIHGDGWEHLCSIVGGVRVCVLVCVCACV